MKSTVILSLVLCCMFACKQTQTVSEIQSDIISINAPQSMSVGETIQVEVEIDSKTPILIVRSPYGSQLIHPSSNEDSKNRVTYVITETITQQSGILDWTLINGKENINGQIQINPEITTKEIEVYIGPTTLMAGSRRSGMTTAVLTDRYDNVISDNHLAQLTRSTQGYPKKQDLRVKDGVIHYYHDATTKSGNIFTSVSSDLSNSEEYTYQVNAGIPTSCLLSTDPQHYFADGSTPLTLETNQLVDTYGNIVENGTLVSFIAIDKKGNISKTDGYTIDGIAKGIIVHPAYSTALTAHAIVSNIKSNTIRITFDEVIDKLPLTFNNAGLLTVGPLQSYMGQMIPDGLPITLKIYKYNEVIHTTTLYSEKGSVSLSLPQVITSPIDSSLWVLVEGAGLVESIAYKAEKE